MNRRRKLLGVCYALGYEGLPADDVEAILGVNE